MLEHHSGKSALQVNRGIEQPPAISDESVKRFKGLNRKKLTLSDYVEGIKKGSRTILGQAITLIESSLPSHSHLAQEIIRECLPLSGNSIRIGITGVPGVGKSTFIESIGKEITRLGKKLAVLAIDPSSEKSKGSILGDKTRMEELSVDENAFIRPSPSAGSLGGVARKTRETIILCEAAGFDVIFIETVGVGQSETMVHSMVDFFLLLMLAGAGDELQGIKRGIMEMADMIAITKSDGSNMDKATRAKAEYTNALHLFPAPPSGWIPKVVTCSALSKQGIPDILKTIEDYMSFTKLSGYFNDLRKSQDLYWMKSSIEESLKEHFYRNEHMKAQIKSYEKQVLKGEMNSFQAAQKLVDEYLKLT